MKTVIKNISKIVQVEETPKRLVCGEEMGDLFCHCAMLVFSLVRALAAALFGDSDFLNASKVALIILWGFELPFDFATMSFMPNDSKRALIGPPAIMPVPGAADLRITFPAPNLPTISWCIVLLSLSDTLIRFFFIY